MLGAVASGVCAAPDVVPALVIPPLALYWLYATRKEHCPDMLYPRTASGVLRRHVPRTFAQSLASLFTVPNHWFASVRKESDGDDEGKEQKGKREKSKAKKKESDDWARARVLIVLAIVALISVFDLVGIPLNRAQHGANVFPHAGTVRGNIGSRGEPFSAIVANTRAASWRRAAVDWGLAFCFFCHGGLRLIAVLEALSGASG